MSSTEKYTNCYQIIPKVCLLSTSLEILLASHWLMGNINWSSVHSHSSLYCVGLLRWLRGKESGCQCRRHCRLGLDPWVRKIPWSRKWQPTPVFCWENPIPTHTHTHCCSKFLSHHSHSIISSSTCFRYFKFPEYGHNFLSFLLHSLAFWLLKLGLVKDLSKAETLLCQQRFA